MNELLTFQAIKDDVENTYPAPIAAIFRKCRIASEGDLGGRHKELVDLYEVLIKFLCVVQLQEARQIFPNFRDRLPQGGKTLQFLKRPSLGGWVGLLRILSHFDSGLPETYWMQRISQWYLQNKRPENIEVLRIFDRIEGLQYETRTKTPHAEICNALVTYRNKQLAHTANIYEAELLKRLPLLEHVLAYLLHSLDFLSSMNTFYTERIELTSHDAWRIHALQLIGINAEPGVLECSQKLELSEIYLLPEAGEIVEPQAVHLGPFFIWRTNETLKKPEMYLYNDAWRTKLEYISYESGSYYYHKELHSDFKELIDIKLHPGTEEDIHRNLSTEDRAERAETTFKQAMSFLEKQQFEDALEALELSAEYERRPKTFVEMAKAQHLLGEPKEVVLQALQNCLDFDPNHADALHLKRILDQESETTVPTHTPPEENTHLCMHEEYPTFFHLVTPQLFKPYAFQFWLALLCAWYGLSGSLEFFTGHPEKILLNILQWALGVLIICCLIVGRRLFLRLRIPLSLQLDSMRLERFEQWFQHQYLLIFGNIACAQDCYVYHWNVVYEKVFLGISVFIILLGGIVGYILCELYTQPVFFMLKRWLDNMIIVVLLGFIIFRYIFSTTIFIYQFSQLSLKPMLTRINDEGFRAFSPLIVSNLLFVDAGFLIYLVLASYQYTHPLPLDFVLLVLGMAFFITWSLGMPITIRIAAKASKSKTIMAYAQHIEKAFKVFLDDPDEEHLNTYKWLLKHQTVIQKIPTWPLSWIETLIVIIGSNIVLLLAVAWNILSRLGYWQNAIEAISTFVTSFL